MSAHYVTRREAAALAGVAVSTIQSHRFPGKLTRKVPFPEPAARFGQVPVWRREDVVRWAAERQKTNHESRSATTKGGDQQ
jgi:hypothetical protein